MGGVKDLVTQPFKQVEQVVRNPEDAFKNPGRTLGSLYGAGAGSLTGAGLLGAIPGSIVGGAAGGLVDNAMGAIGGAGGSLGVPRVSNPAAFDVTEEAARVGNLYQPQQEQAANAENIARQRNLALLDRLDAQSRGQGPSIAEAQMRQASDRNLAQQLAAAQAAKGGNIAAQQRQMAMQQGMAGRQLAQDSAIARLQEQQQAQQMLGQFGTQQQQLSGARAADATAGLEQAIYAPAQAQQQLGLAQLGADTQINLARRSERSGLLGGLLGAGGSVIGLAAAGSDRNMKKNVKSAKKETSKFLDALASRQYEYKDTSLPGTAPGKRIGVMAQDLEKSAVGKTMVADTPQGKMVDTAQGFGALLAAQADMHDRLKKLEGKKGKA